MDVRVLPDGPVLRISQDLGSHARGCRLNPSALEAAVGLVASGLSSNVDLLIINKFGKHEAEGRGFRDVISEAIGMDIPVLVGINALNRQAFELFAKEWAVEIPANLNHLMNWAENAIDRVS
jgi:hypothetical protein